MKIQHIADELLNIISGKVKTLHDLSKHQICLIFEDENNISNIMDIQDQCKKKLQNWWTGIPKQKLIIPSKTFSFAIINGTVDEKLYAMKPTIIRASINLGLIIPVAIKQGNCRLISSAELIEIINNKH